MKDCFIDNQIEALVQKHNTRDPFQLAKEKNIFILREPLGEIKGFYNCIRRIQFIHLNTNLAEQEETYVCGHELGHSILHPYENTPQLSSLSIVSELKIEKEADYFATKLIMDGSHKELEKPTKYEILNYYGLPWYLDRYM